jgi:hypothetical protein
VGKPISKKRSWCVWNIDCDDAERIPWFDAAHHDRFIGQGAGYPSRYAGGLDERLHGIYSDDYMATEVLTGHPGMVWHAFSRDVVRKYWLLADLMRALALRTIEHVEFVDGDIHRQHVRWSGGAEVWVNRGKSDWAVAGRILPEFGFFAMVPTEHGKVEAAIERRDGIIVESARSPDRAYINGRQIAGSTKKPSDFGDATTAGGCRLVREKDAMRLIPLPGGRKFTVRIRPTLPIGSASRWKFVETLDEDEKVVKRRKIKREGDEVVVECEPSVFAYRLVEE